MKKIFQKLMTVAAILWLGTAVATEICVVINLSEQRAYLIEQGRPSLISPIASGKRGWSTPTGSFKILSKDVDHRSGSFGSIINPSGRVIIGNATAASRVPAGCHYRPAPMPYYMEFSPGIGMHGGYLPGYPASHGCVRMPRDLAARFFTRVQVGTPVTVVGSTRNLSRVRKAIPIL